MRKKEIKTIKVMSGGSGSWLISTTIRGKIVSTITTNSQAINDYKCKENEYCEKDKKTLKKLRGYKALYSEIFKSKQFKTLNKIKSHDTKPLQK